MPYDPIEFKTVTAAKRELGRVTKIAEGRRDRFIDAWKVYYATVNRLDAIKEAARRMGIEC